MGYYSKYTLTAEDRRPSVDDAIADLRERWPEAANALEPEGWPRDHVTWYSWIEDMQAFSLQHPGILFTIRRDGEESEDIEIGYFLDGSCRTAKAELRLPDFDELESDDE